MESKSINEMQVEIQKADVCLRALSLQKRDSGYHSRLNSGMIANQDTSILSHDSMTKIEAKLLKIIESF